MLKLRTSGQNLTELALLVSVVVTALVGMQLYLQRSYQARQKAGADFVFRQLRQEALARNNLDLLKRLDQVHQGEAMGTYEPYYKESDITTNSTSSVTQGFPFSSLDSRVEQSGRQWTGGVENAD